MDCPSCGTWNPDDKVVCWRCQTELPKPVEKRKKSAPRFFLGLPAWTWVIMALMLILLIGVQYLGPTLLRGR
jgi:predicted nucleic acid-binding Zn ribbon protein